jgi:hypothetical protein
MTCPEMTPNAPPLSYAMVSFNAGDYDGAASRVAALANAGFKVLTLVPTYEARTEELTATYDVGGTTKRLRKVTAIHAGKTPSIAAMRVLAVAGIEAGMHVRFEPHIDADATVAGVVEAYWRARLVFDPAATPPGYGSVVLRPLFDLIVSLKDLPVPGRADCRPCFSLTLGSELEAALLGSPASWKAILDRFKGLREQQGDLRDRLAFGHKINWDHLGPDRPAHWVGVVNKVNGETGIGPTGLTAAGQMQPTGDYLSSLDYLGVSFYVPLAGDLGGEAVDKEKWRADPTDASVQEMADLMSRQWDRWLGPLRGLSTPTSGPALEISEAGVGSDDASRPYEAGNPASAATPAGRNVARHYVRALGRFIRARKETFRSKGSSPCLVYRPVTFWTVVQYDWFGLDPNWADWRVPDLVEWVTGYNRETFAPPAAGPNVLPRCFVATAAFGSACDDDVRVLRRFRDEILAKTRAGRAFIRAYELASPPPARWIAGGAGRRRVARALLRPFVRFARRRL